MLVGALVSKLVGWQLSNKVVHWIVSQQVSDSISKLVSFHVSISFPAFGLCVGFRTLGQALHQAYCYRSGAFKVEERTHRVFLHRHTFRPAPPLHVLSIFFVIKFEGMPNVFSFKWKIAQRLKAQVVYHVAKPMGIRDVADFQPNDFFSKFLKSLIMSRV